MDAKKSGVKVGGSKAAALYVVKTVGAFALFILYMIPFALVLINSFKRKVSIIKYPLQIIDEMGLQFSNYAEAFVEMGFLRAFGNSLFVVSCSIALLVIFSSMCAYILVRRDYVACRVSYLLLISYMVIPFQVIMIPVLSIYGSALGMLNSRVTLIIMNFAYGTCFATFLCHGFIKTGIPISLEEAAYIDGAGPLQTFFKVVFPLLKPILATNMILQTLGLWNDYLLPNLVLGKEKLQTLPIVIRSFVGTFSSDYSLMMAALVMCVAPIIVLFIFLQKYIVAGIVSGAVKA